MLLISGPNCQSWTYLVWPWCCQVSLVIEVSSDNKSWHHWIWIECLNDWCGLNRNVVVVFSLFLGQHRLNWGCCQLKHSPRLLEVVWNIISGKGMDLTILRMLVLLGLFSLDMKQALTLPFRPTVMSSITTVHAAVIDSSLEEPAPIQQLHSAIDILFLAIVSGMHCPCWGHTIPGHLQKFTRRASNFSLY